LPTFARVVVKIVVNTLHDWHRFSRPDTFTPTFWHSRSYPGFLLEEVFTKVGLQLCWGDLKLTHPLAASRSVLPIESVDDAHVEAGAAVDHVLSVHVRSLEPVITTPAEQDVSVTDEDARVSLVVAPKAVYLVG